MKKKSVKIIVCLSGVLLFAAIAFSADDILTRGTEVVVRIDRDIAMASARPGDTFPATIDQDVVSRGRTLAYRGDRAEVRLMTVRPDTDEVAFNLFTITVNGRQYPVNSDIARQYQDRTATTGGVQKPSMLGAAAGAVLGGATGGGQGAISGAIIGSGGGYSWTGQSRLNARVPGGTRFVFTVRDDVVLRR